HRLGAHRALDLDGAGVAVGGGGRRRLVGQGRDRQVFQNAVVHGGRGTRARVARDGHDLLALLAGDFLAGEVVADLVRLPAIGALELDGHAVTRRWGAGRGKRRAVSLLSAQSRGATSAGALFSETRAAA